MTLHGQLIRAGSDVCRVGSPTGRCLRSLDRSQWLEPAQVAALRWERLRKLLEHAYQTVPYYRAMFDRLDAHPEDITSPADFRRLPTIDKHSVNGHRDAMVSAGIRRGRLMANETGGSTGEPVRFYQDRRYWRWARAGQLRAYGMTGWRPGDPWAFFWGSRWDGMRQTGWRRFPNRWLANLVWINSYCITESQLREAFHTLERLRPRLLVCYVSSVVMLCRYIQEHGLSGRLHIPGVMPSAETLTANDRRLVEETLRCEVFNRYGARECSIVAQECEAHEGLHTWDETNYVELLDGDRSVDAGRSGRVVVTTLTNFSMPLVRYETGDVAAWRHGSCPCGRGLRRLDDVTGRIYEHITTPSGKLISGGAITQLLFIYNDIRQYQVTQTTVDAITVRLVTNSGRLSPELASSIRRAFTESVDSRLQVDVQRCDAIEPGASGKFSYVRSDVLPTFARRDARRRETA